MSMKYIQQVLKSDDDIHVSIARAIASVHRDTSENPKQFAHLYELMKSNPVFAGHAESIFVNTQKTFDAIMAKAPKSDPVELMRRCRMGGVYLNFIAGMQLGAQVAAFAFTDCFEDSGAAKNQPDPLAVAIIEDTTAQLRAEMPAPEESAAAYCARLAHEIFDKEWDDAAVSQTAITHHTPPPMPSGLQAIADAVNAQGGRFQAFTIPPNGSPDDIDSMARKIAENFMASAQDKSETQPGPSGCSCRQMFRRMMSAESLEQVATNMVNNFPAVISDSIHNAGQTLGLKGVVGALDIAKMPNGRGELIAEISRHPVVRDMTHRALTVSAKMTQHGGDITQHDTLEVISTCLASFLGYALTDMSAPAVNPV
jgi:hypothetical protein